MRVVCWFSKGAPSTIAAKLAIAEHGHDNLDVVYCDTGSEHPDGLRILAAAEEWFEHPITIIRSDKYVDTWDVWTRRKFITGMHGAPCTVELKKKPRFAYERPDDLQVFGYTIDERKRAQRFVDQNPGVTTSFPLIDADLSRSDCLAMFERNVGPLQEMYRLGYPNNNCIPCPHGGLGYFNMIRRDFPDAFDRMARLEREFGHALHREDDQSPIWLDELDPARGDIKTEPEFNCSLMCALAEATGAPGRDALRAALSQSEHQARNDRWSRLSPLKAIRWATVPDLEADRRIHAENVAAAVAAEDVAEKRNRVLIPIMEEHGFTTAGKAIEWLAAQ